MKVEGTDSRSESQSGDNPTFDIDEMAPSL
jgi:hypothetical protein